MDHNQSDKTPKDNSFFSQNTLKQLSTFFLENYKIFLMVFIPLVLLGIGLFGWNLQKSIKTTKLRSQLAEIDYIKQKIDQQTQKVLNQYQKEFLEISDDQKDLAKQKRLEILQKIKTYQPDYSQVLSQYIDFSNANKNTLAGSSAAFKASNILIKQKDYSKAFELLDQVYKSPPSARFFQIPGRIVFINLLEDLSKFDQAIEQINLALNFKDLDPEIQSKLLFSKFRLAKLSDDLDSYHQTIDKLVQNHPRSDYTKTALIDSILSNTPANSSLTDNKEPIKAN